MHWCILPNCRGFPLGVGFLSPLYNGHPCVREIFSCTVKHIKQLNHNHLYVFINSCHLLFFFTLSWLKELRLSAIAETERVRVNAAYIRPRLSAVKHIFGLITVLDQRQNDNWKHIGGQMHVFYRFLGGINVQRIKLSHLISFQFSTY